MTGKADFTQEEWELLREGPSSAGLIVVTAQRGGTFRESFALAKAYAEARQQHGESELLDEIVAEKPERDHTRYHSAEELKHALIISQQIDYLGAMPTVTPKPVKVSDKAEEMLRADLQNEKDTIKNYRERVRQCEALGEFAIAEHIREILLDEQDHLIDLATALGEDAPDVSK